jgi:hypothetical protein
MQSNTTSKWLLWTSVILAHLIAILTAPLWVFVTQFSFSVWQQADAIGDYFVFALYWLGPILSFGLLVALWVMIMQKAASPIIKLSWMLVILQSVVFGVLLIR